MRKSPQEGIGRQGDEVIDCSVSEFVPCFAVSFVSPFRPRSLFSCSLFLCCLMWKMLGDDGYAARFDDCVDDEKQQWRQWGKVIRQEIRDGKTLAPNETLSHET